MMGFAIDEERPRRTGYEIGQDLSTLSIEELNERAEELRAEIARLEQARNQKTAQKSAADSVFGRR